MKTLIKFFAIIIPAKLLAQVPKDLPVDTEPVDFSSNPWNYLIYIVIPVVFVVFYIWWRKNRSGKDEK